MKKQSIIILALIFFLFICKPIFSRSYTFSPKSDYSQQHHPISTQNPEAQSFFDQGLTLVYSFNRGAATRSFQRASELDPHAAMAYWGVALALGPNINVDSNPSQRKQAYEAAQQALSLASHATDSEKAYIKAIVVRYSEKPTADSRKLAEDYKNAMHQLVVQYPDDPDAATLYAESLMNLQPWNLWSVNGNPTNNTQTIIDTLEAVLKQHPDHLGANHYYIHTLEASSHPERALSSAQILEKATLEPAAAHLVHMPAHIFLHTGDYTGAIRSNEDAVSHDRIYLRDGIGHPKDTYHSHNLKYLLAAYSMAGRFTEAQKVSEQLKTLTDFPYSTLLLIHFAQWSKILQLPEPVLKNTHTHLAWHYARGMAYATAHYVNLAEVELKKMRHEIEQVSEGVMREDFHQTFYGTILHAKIAIAEKKPQFAIQFLTTLVEPLDRFQMHQEPPLWYFPVRTSLGAALLLNGDYQEAEQIFREDLKKYPRNGRSLFGLLESVKAQKKRSAIRWVQIQLDLALKNADHQKLKIQDL
jgi:tetratricopeptide (TPR) repeat protein